jgi:hypothetical protein
MTLLSHSSGRLPKTDIANAGLAIVKRFCRRVLGFLLAGVALAGVVVLKAAIYLPYFHH